MPANAKTLESMTKHMTENERRAREEAENDLMPKRRAVELKPPAYVRADKAAHRYWKQTVKRMEGITLLDALDTELFAVYCCQLARWERLNGQVSELDTLLSSEESNIKERLAAAKSLAAVSDELRKLEGVIASYTDRLGLSPKSRVGLTQSRAKERELEELDSLFGD